MDDLGHFKMQMCQLEASVKRSRKMGQYMGKPVIEPLSESR